MDGPSGRGLPLAGAEVAGARDGLEGRGCVVEAALETPGCGGWHGQAIEPSVVARYVQLALEKPAHAAVSRLESDLGLTPAAMHRMRLVVEHPESESKREPLADPYRHLRAVDG